MFILEFAKVKDVKSPLRGTSKSAGIDFFVPIGEGTYVAPHERVLIPSGIKVNIPSGYSLIAFNKSGIASKSGLDVLACVVDEDYQGEIHLSLVNTSDEGIYIEVDKKLVQFVLIPMNYCNIQEKKIEELYSFETTRGSGGFGSTDEK